MLRCFHGPEQILSLFDMKRGSSCTKKSLLAGNQRVPTTIEPPLQEKFRQNWGIAGIFCFAWLTSPFWNFWLRIHMFVLLVNLPSSGGRQRNPHRSCATPFTTNEHSMIWWITRDPWRSHFNMHR